MLDDILLLDRDIKAELEEEDSIYFILLLEYVSASVSGRFWFMQDSITHSCFYR